MVSRRSALIGAAAGTGALAALAFSVTGAGAATARMTATPPNPAPGAGFTVNGTGFSTGGYQLTWDSATTGTTVTATTAGTWTATLTMPTGAGTHIVHAKKIGDTSKLVLSSGTPTATRTRTRTATRTRTPTPTPTGGLHIVGNQIVNAAGQSVQLHGVNRSSWEYASVGESGDDGWGFCDPAIPVQAEIDAMLDWHVNVVRISLNQSSWLGIPAGALNPQWTGANYRAAVHTYVDRLTANGIASILNLHWNAPGNQVALDQQIMPDRDHSPAFWASVAASFKNHPMVLFEPYNEPHPDGNNDGDTAAAWAVWRNGGQPTNISPRLPFVAAGMVEMGAAIRGTGANNIIVYTGVNYGSSLRLFLQNVPTDPTGQLAAGWHNYDDGLSCQDEACWNSELLPVAAQYPIIATELGEFTCQSVETVKRMTWLTAHGGHWTCWSWHPGDCADEPSLLQEASDKSNPAAWNGSPSGYGGGVRAYMRTL